MEPIDFSNITLFNHCLNASELIHMKFLYDTYLIGVVIGVLVLLAVMYFLIEIFSRGHLKSIWGTNMNGLDIVQFMIILLGLILGVLCFALMGGLSASMMSFSS